MLATMSVDYLHRHFDVEANPCSPDHPDNPHNWFYGKFDYQLALWWPFKPLTLEAWYSKEEIERIRS